MVIKRNDILIHATTWMKLKSIMLNEVSQTRRLHIVWSDNITAAAAKSLQSCPTLCDPIDGSSPGSPVPGILQARTLEWIAVSFSDA